MTTYGYTALETQSLIANCPLCCAGSSAVPGSVPGDSGGSGGSIGLLIPTSAGGDGVCRAATCANFDCPGSGTSTCTFAGGVLSATCDNCVFTLTPDGSIMTTGVGCSTFDDVESCSLEGDAPPPKLGFEGSDGTCYEANCANLRQYDPDCVNEQHTCTSSGSSLVATCGTCVRTIDIDSQVVNSVFCSSLTKCDPDSAGATPTSSNSSAIDYSGYLEGDILAMQTSTQITQSIAMPFVAPFLANVLWLLIAVALGAAAKFSKGKPNQGTLYCVGGGFGVTGGVFATMSACSMFAMSVVLLGFGSVFMFLITAVVSGHTDESDCRDGNGPAGLCQCVHMSSALIMSMGACAVVGFITYVLAATSAIGMASAFFDANKDLKSGGGGVQLSNAPGATIPVAVASPVIKSDGGGTMLVTSPSNVVMAGKV
jgi:uncharacterized membrane protein